MIWVDASVWLEIALGQERMQKCKDFLASVAKERLFLADFDVYSIVLTMLKYKKAASGIRMFLGVLNGFPRIMIFRPSALLVAEAVESMRSQKLTFDDSLTYACMRDLGIRKLATLDEDFRKLDVELVLR
jgi:predicted nucleic acid-binding protein